MHSMPTAPGMLQCSAIRRGGRRTSPKAPSPSLRGRWSGPRVTSVTSSAPSPNARGVLMSEGHDARRAFSDFAAAAGGRRRRAR